MTIQQILDEYGVSTRAVGSHQNVREGWIGMDCPWCGSGSGKFHLGIHLAKSYVSCWRCGYHRLGDTLMELTGQPWPVVRGWLDSITGSHRKPIQGPVTRGQISIPSGLQALSRLHRAYLSGRGFDPDEIIRLWGIQATPNIGPLAWRLWLPIRLQNKTVSWTTRAIGDRQPRYMTAKPEQESVPAKHLLYGGDLAGHTIIIVEGPLDAWAIGPGAVATLGMQWSQEQFHDMIRRPVRVVCFDAEPAAKRRAERLASELQTLPGETHIIELETGVDAAEADRSEIMEIRRRFLE